MNDIVLWVLLIAIIAVDSHGNLKHEGWHPHSWFCIGVLMFTIYVVMGLFISLLLFLFERGNFYDSVYPSIVCTLFAAVITYVTLASQDV